jgi:hypothetical protein
MDVVTVKKGQMIMIENKKLVLSSLKGVWIYTLMLWIYIVADMFAFPEYQYSAISRFIPIPQNLIAVVAFPVSFLAFVAWEYLRNLDTNSGKSLVRNEARTEIQL